MIMRNFITLFIDCFPRNIPHHWLIFLKAVIKFNFSQEPLDVLNSSDINTSGERRSRWNVTLRIAMMQFMSFVFGNWRFGVQCNSWNRRPNVSVPIHLANDCKVFYFCNRTNPKMKFFRDETTFGTSIHLAVVLIFGFNPDFHFTTNAFFKILT